VAAGDDLASCTLAELGTCVRINAAGELDVAALPLLRHAAERALAADGRTVVLDLCEATFADTSVVHFALGLDARARAGSGELIVVAPPHVGRVFARVGAEGLTVVEDGPAARDEPG
jgi:anti-anti-sigma regulatory factor